MIEKFVLSTKVKEMINFENVLTNVLKNIKFRATKSFFQQQLTGGIRTVKNTKTNLTFADKTSNVYKVPKDFKLQSDFKIFSTMRSLI